MARYRAQCQDKNALIEKLQTERETHLSKMGELQAQVSMMLQQNTKFKQEQTQLNAQKQEQLLENGRLKAEVGRQSSVI